MTGLEHLGWGLVIVSMVVVLFILAGYGDESEW